MIVSKAVKMANMMKIPVLGFVENYSYLQCPDCGKKIEVFGKSHLDEVAQSFGVPILARLPIDPKVASCYDNGLMETVDTQHMSGAIEAIEGIG
jgi:Mrp family chromosome partitioning ATPase